MDELIKTYIVESVQGTLLFTPKIIMRIFYNAYLPIKRYKNTMRW